MQPAVLVSVGGISSLKLIHNQKLPTQTYLNFFFPAYQKGNNFLKYRYLYLKNKLRHQQKVDSLKLKKQHVYDEQTIYFRIIPKNCFICSCSQANKVSDKECSVICFPGKYWHIFIAFLFSSRPVGSKTDFVCKPDSYFDTANKEQFKEKSKKINNGIMQSTGTVKKNNCLILSVPSLFT